MPYGRWTAIRNGNRLTVHIELPEEGEPSKRGFADNLVDPREWQSPEPDYDGIRVNLVVCKTNRLRRR